MIPRKLPGKPDLRLQQEVGDVVHFVEGLERPAVLRLAVRRSVAARRVSVAGRTIFYLSMFEDQIDSRFEQFSAVFRPTSDPCDWVRSASTRLEPTDAVVMYDPCCDDVVVARGGACRFPLYWARKGNTILISTRLPLDQERCLSRSGLLSAIAVVTVALQNEPNFSLRTPLHGWSRWRRGAVSKLDCTGRLSEFPIDLTAFDGTAMNRHDLVKAIRSAFSSFGDRLRGRSRLLVELSGGFDSTLAAIAAQSVGIEVFGVSICFPYYEFRFEEEIQQGVASALSIQRTRLDGTDLLPYAPSGWQPRLDEPATTVMSVKRDLAITQIATREAIDRVLVGQGGDQIFSEDMLQPVPQPSPLARGAFSGEAWREIERTRSVIQSTPIFLRRSTLTYLHDARLDVALKEAFGPLTITPFSELGMVSCALSWARLSARLGVKQGKRILADAFEAELPTVVTNRRSKVSWDGVCARAYAQHGKDIVDVIDSSAVALDKIGFNVRWLTKRARELEQWKTTAFGQDDRELFAAYAMAGWFRSWSIDRVSDCSWTQ